MTWETITPGTWLIFGVVLVPVYGMLLGWFLGSPRDLKSALRGAAYIIGFVCLLWGGLFVTTVMIDLIFMPDGIS